jgi:hypothetical protein
MGNILKHNKYIIILEGECMWLVAHGILMILYGQGIPQYNTSYFMYEIVTLHTTFCETNYGIDR